jgi:predicted RND superfamily exporter protein
MVLQGFYCGKNYLKTLLKCYIEPAHTSSMLLFVKYRWWLSACLLLLAIAGIPFLIKALVPNNALSVWFLEDDPALVTYRQFHKQFGNDEVLVVAIENKEGLFTIPQLGQIRELSHQIEQIEGISEVYSLSNIRDVSLKQGRISYEPLLPDPIPADTGSLHQIARKALLSPLVADKLVNTQGTATILIARMQVMDDIDTRRDAIVNSVRIAAAQILGAAHVHIGGLGVIYAGLNSITRHDFGLFISLSYLCMFIFIWWLYRNIRLVLLALLSILIATLLTLSIYGLLGFGVNMITMMLPTLIIVLGIVDIMHIINEYEQVTGSNPVALKDKSVLLTEVLHNVWKPCLYTTLTTMAGFLSLTVSPMAVLREFGAFAATGLAFALLCSFVFSGLILYDLPPVGRKKKNLINNLIPLLDRQILHVHSHARSYWLIFAGIAAILLYGTAKVVTDTYTIGYLPDDHPVVQDHRFIEQAWGDYFPLEFTVHPLADKTVKEPEILLAMKNFVEEASLLPEVRTGYGLHLLYERAFPLVYGPVWEKKLQSRSAIEGVTRTALRKDPELLRQWVSEDFRTARLTLVGKMMSAAELNLILQKLNVLSSSHFAGIATVRPTGYPPLYAQIVSYIMQSQKRSFLMAVALVFTCMLYMLKDIKLALLSLLPGLFPVLLLLGVMGYAGITLDIATATVAAIVMGISVDDTIHYMYHYRQAKKVHITLIEAQRATVRHVGKAIVLTSLTLFAGYLVLLLASVKTVYYFGLLTAIAIAGALLAQLILFPLLLKTFDKEPSLVAAP